ncbi:type II secretion system protein [Acinetobacter baumannii]|uniref:type II secretion system protein n=1 Tax=Acinetobacter baumannii TaxID=470 RepID=UPI003FA468B0
MKRGNLGFAYIWMLVIFSILAVVIGQWSVNYATLLQREKEQELLRIGLMYRNAIYQYYQNSPNGIRTYPKKIEDLLRDPRYPEVRRYLRNLEKDPMTSREFILIKNNDMEVVGIYSSSKKKPIKKVGFLPSIKFFEAANSYTEWKFKM